MSYWKKFKHTVGGFSHSVSNWEDSYYGGYTKILNDYPTVDVPYDLDYHPDDKNMKDLYQYSHGKLIRIFLYKVKEHKLINKLVENIEVTKVDTGRNKYTRYKLSKIDLSYVVHLLTSKKDELGNLFENYKEVIENTEIFYDEPEKKKEEEGEGKPGDGPPSKEKGKKALKELMDKVGKYEPKKWWSTGGDVSGDLKAMSEFKMIDRRTPDKGMYTPEIVQLSDHLVRLLDISFDSAPDRINNMRVGKLDMRKICEIPCGNFHVYYRTEQQQTTRPFSVCILGDESGSMGGGSIYNQIILMKVLYRAFSQILPQDKMFFYGHTGYDKPEIRVYHDPYNPYFEETCWHMGKSMGENYDGPAIEAIYDKVRGMTEDNILFLSLSDGQPAGQNYGGKPAVEQLKQVIEKCKRDGFVTMGVGMQFGMIADIYHYHTIVRDLNLELVEKTSTLMNRVVKTEFQS